MTDKEILEAVKNKMILTVSECEEYLKTAAHGSDSEGPIRKIELCEELQDMIKKMERERDELAVQCGCTHVSWWSKK